METTQNETQKQRIFAFMKKDPNREYLATDFVRGGEQFVWYEAPTRIWDLCRLWLVAKVWNQGRFALYKLTDKWMNTEVVPRTNLIYK